MAISFRYALVLFCLIFARESDLGSYRSFRQLFKDALDASGTTGLHRRKYSFVQYVSIVSEFRTSLLMRCAASLPFSHIEVTGLPKTALPHDVRRLVQTRNLENVSGSESVDSHNGSNTLHIPFCSSIHGLRPFSADRDRLFDTILPRFYPPQRADTEQGDNDIPPASCCGCSKPFFCRENTGISRPQ